MEKNKIYTKGKKKKKKLPANFLSEKCGIGSDDLDTSRRIFAFVRDIDLSKFFFPQPPSSFFGFKHPFRIFYGFIHIKGK